MHTAYNPIRLTFPAEILHTMVLASCDETGQPNRFAITRSLIVDTSAIPAGVPLHAVPQSAWMKAFAPTEEIRQSRHWAEGLPKAPIVIAAHGFSMNAATHEVTLELGDPTLDDGRFDYGILSGTRAFASLIRHQKERKSAEPFYVRVDVLTQDTRLPAPGEIEAPFRLLA